MAAAPSLSVDWRQYFQGIRNVCPWSLAAYNRGRIDLTVSKRPKPLGSFEARVYIIKNITPRRLKKLCKQLDTEDQIDEWLWSHPRYKNNSTPVPVLIQQNRSRLMEIRKKLPGFYQLL